MTSPDGCTRRDQLDVMIRWALREDMVGAAPPSQMWERIRKRAQGEEKPSQVAWWTGLRMVCASAMQGLLDGAVGSAAVYGFWHYPAVGCVSGEPYRTVPLCTHYLPAMRGELA